MINFFRASSIPKRNKRTSIIPSRLGFEPLEDRRLLSVQEWSFHAQPWFPEYPVFGNLNIRYSVDTDAAPQRSTVNGATTATYPITVQFIGFGDTPLTPSQAQLEIIDAPGGDRYHFICNVSGSLLSTPLSRVEFDFFDVDGTMFGPDTKLPTTAAFAESADDGIGSIRAYVYGPSSSGPVANDGNLSPSSLQLLDKPNIVLNDNSIKWRGANAGGGIEFRYNIEDHDLPQPAAVAFFWADSPGATSGTKAAPDHTTTMRQGDDLFFVIAGGDFTAPPSFNSYLVAVANPANPTHAIEESLYSDNRDSLSSTDQFAVHAEWEFKTIGPTSLSLREIAKNDTYQALLKVENQSSVPIPAAFSLKWVEFRSEGVSDELPPSSTKHFGTVLIPRLSFKGTASVVLGEPNPEMFRHNWEWIDSENPVTDNLLSTGGSFKSALEDIIQDLANGRFVFAGFTAAASGVIDFLSDGLDVLATDRVNTFQYDLTGNGPITSISGPGKAQELVIGVPISRLASYGLYVALASSGAEIVLAGLAEGAFAARFGGELAAAWVLDSAVKVLFGIGQIVGAGAYYDFAKDPPDSDFRRLVAVEPLVLPAADPPLAGVAAEAVKIQLQITALRIAELKARNKADGAELAGDATWFSAQLASAADFASKIALLQTRLVAYHSQLEAVSQTLPPTNPADTRRYFEANGLPDFARSMLSQAGWTPQQITEFTAALSSATSLPVENALSQAKLGQVSAVLESDLGLDQLAQSQQLQRERLGATVRLVTAAEVATLTASETAIEQRLSQAVPSISLLDAIESHLTNVRRLVIETHDPAVGPRLELALGYSARFQLLDPSAAGFEGYVNTQKTAGKISTQSAGALVAQLANVRTALQAGNYPQSAAALQTLLNLVNSQGAGIAAATAEQLRTFIDYLSHSVTGTIFAPKEVASNPVATNDTATTNKNTAITLNVLANDSDPDGTIDPKTVAIVAAPAHGTTSVNLTTGAITYTPASNYTGADSFTYKVKDNSGAFSNVATVSITVNAPPVANNDTATTNKNTAVAINVLSNDSDADGTVNVTTVAIVAAPAHGTTSVNPTTGAITYTPTSNYTGPDSFTYKVKDNRGAYSNVATVSITTNAQQNGSISGKEYFDVTGNGLTADDTPLAGVKVYLDTNNNSVWNTGEPTATTSSDGTYALTGLAAGTYKVRQVAPSGYVRTAPASSDYYSVSLAGGQTSSGNNFANAELGNTSVLSNIVYVINGTRTLSDLRGQTKEGDTVQVSFTVAAGTQARRFTLVSYTAPGSAWDPNTASQQRIFDSDTGVFGPGTHTLAVSNPHSYFQVDFVGGYAIDRLGAANSNIFYTVQNRLFSADNAGTRAVQSSPASLTGSVYHDANNNGVFDAGERPIAGAKVALSGATAQTVFTDIYGTYTFDNLPAGTYSISETQPRDYADGKDKLGNKGGTLTSDTASGIALAAGATGTGYTFGEQQTLSSPLAGNQTQTIAWWNGNTGQALIKALNSGPNSKNLGNWLAANFDNLFGANAGIANNLSGKTNSQVAAYYQSLYANSARRPETETLALALAVYVTNSALAGTTAASPTYGFAVSTTGLGTATANVGAGGAAFGVHNNAILTVTELLSRANARARKGLLWDSDGSGSLAPSETILRNQIQSLFGSVNNT